MAGHFRQFHGILRYLYRAIDKHGNQVDPSFGYSPAQGMPETFHLMLAIMAVYHSNS